MDTTILDRFEEKGLNLLADIVSGAFTRNDPIGFPDRQAYSDSELSSIYDDMLLVGPSHIRSVLKDTEKNSMWYALMRDNPKTAAVKWKLGEEFRLKEFKKYLSSPAAECLNFPTSREQAIHILANLGMVQAKKEDGIWMPKY